MEEDIKDLEVFIGECKSNYLNKKCVEKLINRLKEDEKVIKEKDNRVKRIIKRLDNDIENITKTKAKKSENHNYLDDYTRCRLKAYRTKTKEIKEYIEKEYFDKEVQKSAKKIQSSTAH